MLQPQQSNAWQQNQFNAQNNFAAQQQNQAAQNTIAQTMQRIGSIAGSVLQKLQVRCPNLGLHDPNIANGVMSALQNEMQSQQCAFELRSRWGERVPSDNELEQWLENKVSRYINAMIQSGYNPAPMPMAQSQMQPAFGGMQMNRPVMYNGMGQPMQGGYNPYGQPMQGYMQQYGNPYQQYNSMNQPMQPGPFQTGGYPQYNGMGQPMQGGYNPYGQALQNQGYQQPQQQFNQYNQNAGGMSFYERSAATAAAGGAYGNQPAYTNTKTPVYREPVPVATARPQPTPAQCQAPLPDPEERKPAIDLILAPDIEQNTEYAEFCDKQAAPAETFASVGHYKKVYTKAMVGDATRVTHDIDYAKIELKAPVNSVEQAINDAKSLGLNSKSKEWVNVISADETALINDPYKYMAPKFDRVMELVNNPEVEYEVTAGPVTAREYDTYLTHAIDVIRKIKEQGAAFVRMIEPVIMKEFNRAKDVLFAYKNQDGSFSRFSLDTIDDIADFIKMDKEGTFAKYNNDERFAERMSQALDSSLFAIFRRGEKCYLNPSVASDAIAIIDNHKSSIRISGAPGRFAISGFVPLTEEDRERIADAIQSVFVVLIHRDIVLHNCEVYGEDLKEADLDMDTKDIRKWSIAAVLALTQSESGERPVIVVSDKKDIQRKVPRMVALCFNDILVSKKFLV